MRHHRPRLINPAPIPFTGHHGHSASAWAICHPFHHKLAPFTRVNCLAATERKANAQMPSGSTRLQAKPIPATYRRALSALSSSQPVAEPRRSCRSRRPSLHKVESDEYQASSRGSSRPPSPSGQTSKDKSDEDPRGKRGNRPGRIVQPDDAWAACHSSSLEPLAKSGSPPRDFGMADKRATADKLEVQVISKSEAIRRVSAYLGYDATRMPNSILKEVLAEIPNETQADPPCPMEVEGGTAPALLQSADRMVLGRGRQPSTGGTPVAPLQEPEAQLAYPDVLSPSGRSALEAPPDDGSATEPESEPEIIELGPEDSVSQRIPLASQPIPAIPNSLHHSPRPTSNPKRSNPDTATVDESDDSDIDTTHNAKRRRSDTQSPRVAHSPLASITHTRARTSASRMESSSRRSPTAPTPRSITSSSLLNPPPTSNVDAVLSWATHLAAKAASPNVVANPSAGPSRQAGPTNQANDQYGLLASVLENLRSHLATSAPKSRVNTERRLLRPKKTDFIEDDAEFLEAEAALALGKRIRPRHKPCLADFPGFRRHIASSAIPDLNATLVAQGMYEVYGTVTDWAEKSYNHTWATQLPDEPLQKAPAPLLAIMAHRASSFHGEMLLRLRPEVAHQWPFIRTPHTPDDLQYNIRLTRKLLPNQFHCRDPKTGTDPYEHPGLQPCIATGLFWGPESVGAVFRDRFRPLSLAAVAFVLTITQHCIEEWRTGRYVKTELGVNQQRKVYESHLTGLLEYDRKAPTRLGEFRGAWFKHGLKHADASAGPEAPYQPTTRADQIRADSPAHGVDPPAHAAKGKGRAVY